MVEALVTVPFKVPKPVGVHPGMVNATTQVSQSKLPVVATYSAVPQKVHPSGSVWMVA